VINFIDYQDDLIALLSPIDAEVRGLPETPQQQGLTYAGDTLIVVAWMGSAALDTGGQGYGSFQGMNNTIVAEFRASTLSEIYALPKLIHQYWHGQRVAGLGRLDYRDWQFTERNRNFLAGVTTYNIVSQAAQ